MHDGSGRITVQQLTKRFGPVTAVQNLSFTVEPGSVTGFLGPNGAGKTTTLRMVLGLVRPTVGLATVNGTAFAGLGDPARVVGAVLEAQNFHPKRSARNHLRVYAAAIGVPDTRVEQVLQLVGLGDVGGRKAGGFSMGMKQRLALATALLGDPQILVLDEPSNGLDPEGIAWLRTFLQSFARSGRTVLVSSHILAEVEQTVDQLIIISRGQTMYNGPLEHLRRSQQTKVLVRPSDPEKLVGALRDAGIYNIETLPDGRLSVTGVQPKQIADIALTAAVSVYGIEEERVNLEQLYFSLTQGQYTPGAVPQQSGPGQQPYPMPQQGYQPQGYQPPLTYQAQQYQQYQQPQYQQPQDQPPPAQQTQAQQTQDQQYQPAEYQPSQYLPPASYQPPPLYQTPQDAVSPYQPPQYQPPQYQPPQYQPPQGYSYQPQDFQQQQGFAQQPPAQPTPPTGFSPWQQQQEPPAPQAPQDQPPPDPPTDPKPDEQHGNDQQQDPTRHDQGGLGGSS